MAKQTLTGPGGIRLILDSAEIFPDDPGQGTPAIVQLDRDSATYHCAVNEGELNDGTQLTSAQSNWLDAQEETVWAFLEREPGK